ncbi:MAG: hypothetical protein IPJ90_16355 [Anaerolineaceae bacterium]|nr:hypothetical protein [Anaerolineaceae bacterium]
MKQPTSNSNLPQDVRSPFIRRAGTILAVSYPVLALSTGFRSVYQLFLKEGVGSYTGPTLSAVAALCYLTATIGFAYRRRWAWWLSVLVLGFESLMTLIVGTLSIIDPELIGHTVWRLFGIDYGFFPLLQPLLGLAWLFHPETLESYGIRPSSPTDPA